MPEILHLLNTLVIAFWQFHIGCNGVVWLYRVTNTGYVCSSCLILNRYDILLFSVKTAIPSQIIHRLLRQWLLKLNSEVKMPYLLIEISSENGVKKDVLGLNTIVRILELIAYHIGIHALNHSVGITYLNDMIVHFLRFLMNRTACHLHIVNINDVRELRVLNISPYILRIMPEAELHRNETIESMTRFKEVDNKGLLHIPYVILVDVCLVLYILIVETASVGKCTGTHQQQDKGEQQSV